jgi:hypothetical protein
MASTVGRNLAKTEGRARHSVSDATAGPIAKLCDSLLLALLVAVITLALLDNCGRLDASVGRQGAAHIIAFFELAAVSSTDVPFVAFVRLDQFAWHLTLRWKTPAVKPGLAQIRNIVPCRKRLASFSLDAQAQKTCNDYDHDHHTDDVKDVHCVLLRVRDAICFEGWPTCDWRTQLVLSCVSKP